MKRFLFLLLLAGCFDFDFGVGDNTPPSPPPPPFTPPPPTGALFSNFGPEIETDPPPLPISGGTMFVSQDGGTVVAADPDRDVIWLVDLERRSQRGFIQLATGDEPWRGVEDSSGRAHVVLRRGGAVVTFRIDTAEILERRSVCNTPRGIAFDPASGNLHVACQSGKLVTLSAEGGDPIFTIELLPDLRDVVVVGSELWVSRFRSAEILRLDATGSFERVDLRAASPIGFEAGVAWRMIPYADGVAVLHQLASTAELTNNPVTGAPEYYGAVGLGGCPVLVQSAISFVDPSGVRTLPSLSEAVLAVDLAFAPRKEIFAVAIPGNTGTTQGSAHYKDSDDPFGYGCMGPTRIGPVTDFEVTSVAIAPDERVITQLRTPAIQVSTDPPIELSVPQDATHFGHALFHRNSGAGITCASCHPEGGEDGRAWAFTDVGIRRTQSLRTSLKSSAPFHWSGDMASLEDLMQEVFTIRMRGPWLSDRGREIFSNWLQSIRSWPSERPDDPDAVARGLALFEDPGVGCAACHSGGTKTNNQSADVGTGEVLQVPSLLGVSARLPVMHDGCAESLRDRFDPSCGGGDQHGVTSHLTEAELEDLVAYLRSL